MKLFKEKIRKAGEQCSICSAKFKVWLDNLKAGEERKEKIGQHILKYCLVCLRASEN